MQALAREPLGQVNLLAGQEPLLTALQAAHPAARPAALVAPVPQLLAIIVQVGRSYFEYSVIKVVMNQI